MRFAVVLPLSLLFLFIFFKKTSIRIIHQNKTTVQINFTLLSITLISDKRKNKKSFKKRFKTLKNAFFLIKSARYTLKKSNITVFTLPSNHLYDNPMSLILPTTRLISSGLIIAYLENNCDNFFLKNDEVPSIPNDKSLDILLETRLINLFILPLIFLYYKVKSTIRRIN